MRVDFQQGKVYFQQGIFTEDFIMEFHFVMTPADPNAYIKLWETKLWKELVIPKEMLGND